MPAADRFAMLVLLHRHRVVRAAFDRRVVGDDDALAARHPPDAANDRGGMHVAAVHPPGGKLADLEERRAGIEQRAHPLAGQHLAARSMLVARGLVAADGNGGDLLLEIGDEAAHALGVGAEFRRACIHLALDRAHPSASVRPMTIRWISLAPS